LASTGEKIGSDEELRTIDELVMVVVNVVTKVRGRLIVIATTK